MSRTLQTCTQHSSCVQVTEDGKVRHVHATPTTEDVAVTRAQSAVGSGDLAVEEVGRASKRLEARAAAFRTEVSEAERVTGIRFDRTVLAEKELQSLAEEIQGAAARGRARIRQEAEAAAEAVSKQVEEAASAIDALTQEIDRRLAKGRHLLAQGADRARAQVAEAKAWLEEAGSGLVSEYSAYTDQLSKERTRLLLARQAFSEEALAVSDKLRADAKGIIEAAHTDLKNLASLKESLQGQVLDLLRSAKDAEQAVGALTP